MSRKILTSRGKKKQARDSSTLKDINSYAQGISPGHFSQPRWKGCSVKQPEQELLLKAAVKYFSWCLGVAMVEILLICFLMMEVL